MIKVAAPQVGQEEIRLVSQVLLSGRYASGPKVKEFEEAFARYVGVEHAVAVNSGTAALHVIMAALGIAAGDEVIVPPLSFFATVSSVLHAGAVPVFADIDPETYCLDPAGVEQALTERTKAVLPVHLFGQSCDMDGLARVCAAHDLVLIEDCAQSHGTTWDGKVTGSFGRAGAFSFFATKHITTGEGGIITTDDAELAAKARKIRSHGMGDRDTHELLGYNYRMNEIAAAIGLAQLPKLDEFNRRRRAHSLELIQRLSDLPWLSPPQLLPGVDHTFFWVAFRVDEEKAGLGTAAVIERLREQGVEVRHRYREPLYRQPVLMDHQLSPNYSHRNRRIDYRSLRLKQVEAVAGKLIGLPNHPGLTPEDLDQVVRVVRNLI